jgi:hypothetical protein
MMDGGQVAGKSLGPPEGHLGFGQIVGHGEGLQEIVPNKTFINDLLKHDFHWSHHHLWSPRQMDTFIKF